MGEDPFAALKQEKRERVKAQRQRQVANVKASSKDKGGPVVLPPTLKLAAALPLHGKGKPSKRQEMQNDVSTRLLCAQRMDCLSLFRGSESGCCTFLVRPAQVQPAAADAGCILEPPRWQLRYLPGQTPCTPGFQ